MIELMVKDESLSGNVQHQVQLVFKQRDVTLRDIIAERIEQEVKAYNERTKDVTFRGFVKPNEKEAMLNAKTGNPRQVDAKKQIDVAIKAFSQNGFFILIDEDQEDDLDKILKLSPTTEISFVKLIPLVGG